MLLREDIWRSLRFNNKSHLFGRTVTLEWRDQADYAKTVIKQAVRAPAFAELAFGSPSLNRDVDELGQDEVFRIWNLLVGERMKGGKTTFTRNWVWNRLADGNGDHSPRYLLQLFRAATDWERDESAQNPYERSLIRPRALAESLPTVSQEAVQALFEEFSELEPLVDRLRGIGRSPLDATDLEGFSEQVDLAREVGLLAVYEGTEEEVSRYRIPDLFRSALGITRKGPV